MAVSRKLWILINLNFYACFAIGLQGIATWICLGLKSPFIEFKAEIEALSNTSILLNITKDEQFLMHEQGLRKLGTFIRPVDIRNSTTGFVKSNFTKTVPVSNRKRDGVTSNPIAEEMDQKNIELIDDGTDDELLNAMNRDMKFIVPMALKNPAQEVKKEARTEFSTNIDDLKNHILKLQNLTKANKNFEDKFVVFPSIQRQRGAPQSGATTTSTTRRPVTSARPKQYESPPRKKDSRPSTTKDTPVEHIAIIPQVLLLNDQTSQDDDPNSSEPGERDKPYTIPQNRRNRPSDGSTPLGSGRDPPRRTSNQQRSGTGGGKRKKNRRKQNCKNPNKERCRKQRRRPQGQRQMSALNSTLNTFPTQGDWTRQNRNEFKLLRSIRSHKRRNSGSGVKSSSDLTTYELSSGTNVKNATAPVWNVNGGNNSSSFTSQEKIDINPNLCYDVDGLTYGQRRLCVLHTNIMPAISRGARAAIQECQHQLKNRRWNCSTTNDNTVFGPMTSIGSPEMAFIHALAAATVTSFVARACRDGQLASCGCSRSAKPKPLHDDWIWGGCGDDLEFAYKFSQTFIDIRETERKRGARGLISLPPKSKGGSDSPENRNNSTGGDLGANKFNGSNTTSFKPEDLLELNEKITKEILNSKLHEKEMLALKEKISREILNSNIFGGGQHGTYNDEGYSGASGSFATILGRPRTPSSEKAYSLMNLHNNEAGRRAVIKKTRITCKCHGVSGSCSLITCWQQLSSIREIGDYLREKYDAATEVKLNRRGRLQVKDLRYKIPTAHDLVFMDESPDWCRSNRQLNWPGTHGRVCNKTSAGLDGCGILCCGRGYNTKNIVVRERCNCKFHWCCQVKCETCVKVLEEHTCK
ncbi:unnamed protein product [Hermetia illucens]|uniref:Protein Wnt n=1 Tax=Hermetia illucens TaxID=343691 RepID=A0A7R8UB26_HERIL|nr:protein Wnt-5 [Hermetia illucens]CAD7077424.1 unnamed protein product [Hermetia illucens]